MRTPRRTAVAAATIALALTACGSNEDATSSTSETTASDGAASSTDPAPDDGEGEGEGTAAEQTTEVDIAGFRFAPPTIEIASGETVTWTNGDATAHTVTAGSEDAPEPDRFDLRVDEKGQTVETTFEEAGTYAYYCTLHPFMEGTITVTG